jgi:hypothetical protein
MVQNSPATLKATVNQNVPATENVIWYGQPKIKLFRTADIIQIPFMIVWTSGAGFIFCGMLSIDAAAIPFAIVPALFFFIGCYVTFGRFIHQYLVFKDCVYVITDRRAYVITNFPMRKVSSAEIAPTAPVVALQSRDGTADIIFQEMPDFKLLQWQSDPFFLFWNDKPLAFRAVASAKPAIEYLRTASKLIERGVPTAFGMVSPAVPTITSSGSTLVPQLVATNEFNLLPDEQILWQGKPDRNFHFRRTDLAIILFNLVFAAVLSSGVTFALEVASIHAFSWAIYTLSLLLLVTLFATSEAMLKASTKYAITNRRVISLWKQPMNMVKQSSLDFAGIDSIICSTTGDNTGTIVFNMKNHLLVRMFGAEGVILDPRLIQRSEPFLLDVPKTRSVVRLIEQHRQTAIEANRPAQDPSVALMKRSASRELPAGLANRVTWFSQTSAVVFFGALIAGIVGTGHMYAYGFQQMHSLFGGVPLSGGPPQFLFLLPLMLMCAAPGAIIWHISKSRMQIKLLKMGVAATGSYQSESAVAYVNGRPSLIKRTYEFTDPNGVRRTASSLVGTKIAIKKEVTVLFDESKPSDNVVLDDLPGEPKLSDSGNLQFPT